MDRRRFLKLGAGVGVGAAVGSLGPAAGAGAPARRITGTNPVGAAAPAPVPEFPSGILSGDPTDTAVIIWTRIDPTIAGAGIDVTWTIASDPDLRDPIASGTVRTDPDAPTTTIDDPIIVDPDRTMLGRAQKAWLTDGLAASTTPWKILGSQLVFSPLRSQLMPEVAAAAGDGPQRNAGRYLNVVGWDGYQAERREIVDHVHGRGIDGVVVLSGDSHFWTVSNLSRNWDDPDAPPVLTEFGGDRLRAPRVRTRVDPDRHPGARRGGSAFAHRLTARRGIGQDRRRGLRSGGAADAGSFGHGCFG